MRRWLLALLIILAATPAQGLPPHDAPWTPVPLGALGLDGYIRQKWREPSLTLRYRTRIDRLITAARLRLVFASTRLDGIKGMTIRLNGVRIADLDASELAAGHQREIPVDARLVTPDNQLSFALTGPRSCVAAGAWAALSPDSALEVQSLHLRSRGGVDELPLPFFDPLLENDVEVPFVFAEPPSLSAVRAAFVLAGAFALATRAAVRFVVHVGALPPGNAVVVATPAQLTALGVSGEGLVDNPRGASQLLVVVAADDALVDAAETLAARLTHDVRAPLAFGGLVPFSSLAPADRLIVHGRRDGEIAIDFALPPAAVFWRDAGLPVTLLLRAARDAAARRIGGARRAVGPAGRAAQRRVCRDAQAGPAPGGPGSALPSAAVAPATPQPAHHLARAASERRLPVAASRGIFRRRG
jgi:hypothetical protein